MPSASHAQDVHKVVTNNSQNKQQNKVMLQGLPPAERMFARFKSYLMIWLIFLTLQVRHVVASGLHAAVASSCDAVYVT